MNLLPRSKSRTPIHPASDIFHADDMDLTDFRRFFWIDLQKPIETQRPELLDEIPDKAWKASWCSFCVPYGRGEKAVLNYLSRYVFRTAVTNHRIVEVTETEVTL